VRSDTCRDQDRSGLSRTKKEKANTAGGRCSPGERRGLFVWKFVPKKNPTLMPRRNEGDGDPGRTEPQARTPPLDPWKMSFQYFDENAINQ